MRIMLMSVIVILNWLHFQGMSDSREGQLRCGALLRSLVHFSRQRGLVRNF